MNRIEDGDDYLRPLNMALAGDPMEPSGMGQQPAAMPTNQSELFTETPKNGATNGKSVEEH